MDFNVDFVTVGRLSAKSLLVLRQNPLPLKLNYFLLVEFPSGSSFNKEKDTSSKTIPNCWVNPVLTFSITKISCQVEGERRRGEEVSP